MMYLTIFTYCITALDADSNRDGVPQETAATQTQPIRFSLTLKFWIMLIPSCLFMLFRYGRFISEVATLYESLQ